MLLKNLHPTATSHVATVRFGSVGSTQCGESERQTSERPAQTLKSLEEQVDKTVLLFLWKLTYKGLRRICFFPSQSRVEEIYLLHSPNTLPFLEHDCKSKPPLAVLSKGVPVASLEGGGHPQAR